jgi:hypothetical protein
MAWAGEFTLVASASSTRCALTWILEDACMRRCGFDAGLTVR